jgi:hypothetical protein
MSLSPSFLPKMPPPGSSAVMSWVDILGSQDSGLITSESKIDGLAFDYMGEVKIESNSDITEHYMEDNNPTQDHIALAPRRVTLRGIVGELVAGPRPRGVLGVLNNIQDSLTTIPGYLPGKTPQYILKAGRAISKAQNIATQVSSAVSRGKSLWNMFSGGNVAATKQAKMYQKLETIRQNRSILVTVNTPFLTFENMAIESITSMQPEDTKFLSEFTVTLKEIRYAAVIATQLPGSVARMQGASPQKNLGRLYGSKLDVGVLDSLAKW